MADMQVCAMASAQATDPNADGYFSMWAMAQQDWKGNGKGLRAVCSQSNAGRGVEQRAIRINGTHSKRVLCRPGGGSDSGA